LIIKINRHSNTRIKNSQFIISNLTRDFPKNDTADKNTTAVENKLIKKEITLKLHKQKFVANKSADKACPIR